MRPCDAPSYVYSRSGAVIFCRTPPSEMLKLLRVNNIALIPALEVEFGPGLTLLTGETGAGKSILIDALGLLLGDRASPDLIRSGEERATVEAVFELTDAAAPPRGARPARRRGRGRDPARAAGERQGARHRERRPRAREPPARPGPAAHGHPRPARAPGAARPLDPPRPARPLRRGRRRPARSRSSSGTSGRRRRPSSGLRGDRREAERRREMLEFQVAEIEKAALAAGEEEALRVEKARQANAGRLATLSGEAYGLLYDDEEAALSRLGQVFRRVEELAAIDPSFQPFLEARAGSLAPARGPGAAPARLPRAAARSAPGGSTRSRRGSPSSSASRRSTARRSRRCSRSARAAAASWTRSGSPEEQERTLEARRERLAASYLERGRALSKRRRLAALDLRKRVAGGARAARDGEDPLRGGVHARGRRGRGGPLGVDRAGPRASRVPALAQPRRGAAAARTDRLGGELSRIMLALKSVVRSDVPGLTLVFDEVDAGIGGRVAEVVGRKLRAVAARQQVLCVTHLPQIAALADQHLAVRKTGGAGAHGHLRRVARGGRPGRGGRAHARGRDGHRHRTPARSRDAQAGPSHLMAI